MFDCKKQKDENGIIPCAFVDRVNLGNDETSWINVCPPVGGSNCNSSNEIGPILFHEIFHTCDREGTRYKDYLDICDEKRASQAASCIFNDKINNDYFEHADKHCIPVTGNI